VSLTVISTADNTRSGRTVEQEVGGAGEDLGAGAVTMVGGEEVRADRQAEGEQAARLDFVGIGAEGADHLAQQPHPPVVHPAQALGDRLRSEAPAGSEVTVEGTARAALDEIGINIPRIDVSVARLSGGQRQAIAVARTVNSDADIILLDEPLAAMGAKEGAQILDLVARLKAEGRVSIIMILHNYVHVLEACDRVSLIQDGVISLDKPTAETSVEELTDIVVNQYRRAREEIHAEEAAADGAVADG